MVRFIINGTEGIAEAFTTFTFQYGQIYYLYCKNMRHVNGQFTFQYGQIYYAGIRDDEFLSAHIYIPIWLDLLYIDIINFKRLEDNLHSNMVRFIIKFQQIDYFRQA